MIKMVIKMTINMIDHRDVHRTNRSGKVE
jgi:hypothetical protein